MKIALETLPPSVAHTLGTCYANQEIEANGVLKGESLKVYEALLAQSILPEIRSRLELWRDIASEISGSPISSAAIATLESQRECYESMILDGKEQTNLFLQNLSTEFLTRVWMNPSQFSFSSQGLRETIV